VVAQETRGARGRGTGLPESHGQVTTVIASFLGFVASLLDPALKLPATYALVTDSNSDCIDARAGHLDARVCRGVREKRAQQPS
jgi:hypothetical protein